MRTSTKIIGKTLFRFNADHTNEISVLILKGISKSSCGKLQKDGLLSKTV